MAALSEDYELLASLPLQISGYRLEGLEPAFEGPFERRTTVIRLQGHGLEGVGEDITYEAEDHAEFQDCGRGLAVGGSFTLLSFSEHLDQLQLYSRPPLREESRHYRRWAWESAALDLALKQNDLSLHAALRRTPRPVRFAVSMGVGRPPTTDRLYQWREFYPQLEFKLDATSDWDDAFCRDLQKVGSLPVIDFKGYYQGTVMERKTDPDLYERVAAAFPNTVLEDPFHSESTDSVLKQEQARLSWDGPIHTVADVEALPFRPRFLNIKPSRSGRLLDLMELYAWCEGQKVQTYGGGQFELGPGRGQIIYLASLFHPDGPNDVAPAPFNRPDAAAGLPNSPLSVAALPTGFQWESPTANRTTQRRPVYAWLKRVKRRLRPDGD